VTGDAIKRWAKPYVVTRRAANAYDGNGRVTATTDSTVNITAVVVPLQGRELDRLPEGRTNTEVRAVFTTTALKVADASFNADQILINGALWEVQSVESWEQGIFYRAIVQEI
jgi:hypothetical protein